MIVVLGDLDAIAAGAFGLVEGGVGAGDELGGLADEAGRRGGDAEAEAVPVLISLHPSRVHF